MNNSKDTRLVPRETPPLLFQNENGGVDISIKNKALLLLVHLYLQDKDDLFWVLNQIKLRIQNDEASHLADTVIRRAKNEKPKA